MTDDIEQLFSSSVKNDRVVSEQDLARLPEPVQRNLRYTQVIGKQWIHTVCLRQKGYFRMKQDQKWMSMSAKQYYTIDPPSFIWQAKVKANPLFWISGKDRYYQGKGNMKIKLWSFIKVADVIGPKLDQGAMIRYLSEIIWFPTAYLSECIKWESVAADSAKATMSYDGVTASAIFHYDQEGKLLTLTADRYMGMDERATLEKWSTPIGEYAARNGFMIPISGKAVWNLSSGDFTYFDGEITDIEYNNPSKY
jgi:hypothetical protein